MQLGLCGSPYASLERRTLRLSRKLDSSRRKKELSWSSSGNQILTFAISLAVIRKTITLCDRGYGITTGIPLLPEGVKRH